MLKARAPQLLARLGEIGARAAGVLEAPWFGYPFGVAAVLLTTVLLELLLPQTRLGNASTLYIIPVLVTAALSGRGPALTASVAALLALRRARRGWVTPQTGSRQSCSS